MKIKIEDVKPGQVFNIVGFNNTMYHRYLKSDIIWVASEYNGRISMAQLINLDPSREIGVARNIEHFKGCLIELLSLDVFKKDNCIARTFLK